jgi:hypothetical protein
MLHSKVVNSARGAIEAHSRYNHVLYSVDYLTPTDLLHGQDSCLSPPCEAIVARHMLLKGQKGDLSVGVFSSQTTFQVGPIPATLSIIPLKPGDHNRPGSLHFMAFVVQ